MAKRYYCHKCAQQLGLTNDLPTGKVIQTPYQYNKYLKHTVEGSTYRIHSIFSDPSTSAYADHIVNAMCEGAVEIDDFGRKNIIWCAGRHTGFRYESGKLIRPSDAVKVVLSSDINLVHAFPENSTTFNTEACSECGNLIVC